MSTSYPLRVVLPVLAALIAAGAWCGYWLYASREAQARIASFETRLKEDGVSVDCADRSWGGFPFRLVMGCRPFTIRMRAPDSTLMLARAEFLAQAYNRGNIIMVAGSPGRLQWLSGPPREFEFDKAVAGYLGDGAQEVSIEIDALASAGMATVEELRFHLQRPSADTPQIEYAFSARNAAFTAPESGQESIDSMSTRGAFSGAGPGDAVRIDIHRLDMATGNVRVDGAGRVGLDAAARLQGRLALNITNLRQMLDRLRDRGLLAVKDSEPGLALLGLIEASSGGMTRIDLRADHGEIHFGPFRLGEVPPLR